MNYSIRFSYVPYDARGDRRSTGTRMITASDAVSARALAETMREDLARRQAAKSNTFQIDDVAAIG